MNLNALKKKLIAEKENLESELGYIGEKDKERPGNYNAQPAETDQVGFRDEVADRLEEYDERLAIEQPLEARLRNVTDALERIEHGAYGFCNVCGQKIEDDRLAANPSARTCKAHIKESGDRA